MTNMLSLTEQQLVAEAQAMLEKAIADSLKDPDIVCRSDDFKAGYAQGMREAIASTLPVLMARRTGPQG